MISTVALAEGDDQRAEEARDEQSGTAHDEPFRGMVE